MSGVKIGAGLRLGQVSRRQPGGSVLLNQLLQERRHAGGRRRHGCRGLIQGRTFSGTPALSVFAFVQGKEPAEDGSGFGIGQVNLAQIPASRAHTEPLEMIVAGGDLKTDTLQADGAVRAALGAIRFGRESHFKFGTGWTGPPHVAVVEVTLQRGFTKFRVDAPIAFHLDPGQGGFVELSQSQISDSFEHRQQAPFDPVPKGFLFAILEGRIRQSFFVYNTQPCQALRCLGCEHGRAIVAHQGPG